MQARTVALLAAFILSCGDTTESTTPDSGVKPDTGTGCEQDSDCENPFPACLNGRCVQCRADAFCPRATPYCLETNFCAECRNEDDCPLGQVCTGVGICQDCPRCSPPEGYCALVNGRPGCVQCRENIHCNIDNRHYCDPASYVCVECLDDTQCTDLGLRCITTNSGKTCG